MTNRESVWEKLAGKAAGYTDDEILDALKKRDRYEPAAVKIFVDEAVKRGLIHSEQDLFSPGFACEPRRLSLFPVPENRDIQRRIIRSFSRTLMIAGAIPILAGVKEIAENQLIYGIVMIIAGIIWVAAAFVIFRQQRREPWMVMLALALIGCVFAGWQIFSANNSKIMDYAVFIVISGVLFYALFYLRKLLNPKKTQQ